MKNISYTSKGTTPQQAETRNVADSEGLNNPSVGGSAIASQLNKEVV